MGRRRGRKWTCGDEEDCAQDAILGQKNRWLTQKKEGLLGAFGADLFLYPVSLGRFFGLVNVTHGR